MMEKNYMKVNIYYTLGKKSLSTNIIGKIMKKYCLTMKYFNFFVKVKDLIFATKKNRKCLKIVT